MIIDTPRLHLRPVVESDVPNIQRHFAHWDIIQHLLTVVPWPYPDDGAMTFFKTVIEPKQGKDEWFWAINEKERPNDLIGVISLRRDRVENGENCGFWLALPFHGQGYMTEALRGVIGKAFDELGYEEILIACHAGNKASRRTQEKAGLKHIERKERGTAHNNGIAMSDIQMIRKADWLSSRSA